MVDRYTRIRKITNCDGEIAGMARKERCERENNRRRVKLKMGAKLGIVIITDM